MIEGAGEKETVLAGEEGCLRDNSFCRKSEFTRTYLILNGRVSLGASKITVLNVLLQLQFVAVFNNVIIFTLKNIFLSV